MKILFPIAFLLFNLNLMAQDDDFFLRAEDTSTAEDSILESTQFGADDGGYFDNIVKKTFMDQSRVMEYEPLREIDVLWDS